VLETFELLTLLSGFDERDGQASFEPAFKGEAHSAVNPQSSIATDRNANRIGRKVDRDGHQTQTTGTINLSATYRRSRW
jgi:hypothetical protein